MNKRADLSSARRIRRYFNALLITCFLTCITAPIMAETVLMKDGSIHSAVKTISETARQPVTISFDILSVITAAGIIQGFFLAFLLFKIKGGNHQAERILAFFLIVLSLSILPDIYFFTGLFHMFPKFSFVGETYPWFFLICPLLYFYVVNLTIPSFRFKPIHLVHLLPACIATLHVIRQLMTESAEAIELFWISYINDTAYQFSISDTILIMCVMIQSGIYLIFAMHLLAKHKKRIKELFSSIEHINLSWLNYIVRFIFFIYIFLAISFVYWFLGGSYGWISTQRIFPALLTLFIFAFGYKGLTQHKIFSEAPDAADENRDILDERISTSIPPVKIREIMDKLTRLMEEQKPYLNPELTLPMLADMLSVPRNYLSQAINEDRKQNFFDFINTYRVKTAKEYLEDPAKQSESILNIAFNAGFNSKATFNFVFKKITNLTPTEVKKKVQKP